MLFLSRVFYLELESNRNHVYALEILKCKEQSCSTNKVTVILRVLGLELKHFDDGGHGGDFDPCFFPLVFIGVLHFKKPLVRAFPQLFFPLILRHQLPKTKVWSYKPISFRLFLFHNSELVPEPSEAKQHLTASSFHE